MPLIGALIVCLHRHYRDTAKKNNHPKLALSVDNTRSANKTT